MNDRPSSLGPLGQTSFWPSRIDPTVLFVLPRAQARELAGLADEQALPPAGEDTWTAWEFAWRDAKGWPHSAVLQLTIPASSPKLIESKSLKLYLHGFAEQRLTRAALLARLDQDLSAALQSSVRIELLALDDVRLLPGAVSAHCIDAPLQQDDATVDPTPLEEFEGGEAPLAERMASAGKVACISHTFGSLCPVTGQPDWASVHIVWQGFGPTFAGLARYLTSFRHHRGFHEACVEQIWRDVWQSGRLDALSVRAQFTRRGGIDIAPARSHDPDALLPWTRLSRL